MNALLRFIETPPLPLRKTKSWNVYSAHGGELLGFVYWYCAWRRYVFNPVAQTVYDAACLRAAADFCEQATADRKAARAAEKAAQP